jgi:hypothetical protein
MFLKVDWALAHTMWPAGPVRPWQGSAIGVHRPVATSWRQRRRC